MVYIQGVHVSDKKRVCIGLTSIYGIGLSRAKNICRMVGITDSVRASELTDLHISRISKIIDQLYKVESDLSREIFLEIKRLADINCYRGNRHKRGLPVRGQRTHTNAQTSKLLNRKIFHMNT